ncbi:MAG: glutamate racemase [Myxococcota bacterium]
MNPNDLPIGVFDSGIGGLSVLSAIKTALPNEPLLYLGDTARVPYGSRSPETIVRYTQRVAGHLLKRGVKALVIACNTATTYGYEAVNTRCIELGIPVVGVIQPGAQAASALKSVSTVAVLGTVATVNGGQYTKELQALNPNIRVIGKACPLLVPLVEEGWLNDHITEQIIVRYLNEIEGKPDAIILGCTHYPLLKHTFERILPKVTIIDSASVAAKALKRILKTEGKLRMSASSKIATKYLVTDNLERFKAIGQQFLHDPLNTIELVDLTDDDEQYMKDLP